MSFNDLSSPQSLLATRRSGKPRDMIAPGPDAGQLHAILSAAMRVPDHGKLAPWRFVVIDDRAAFAALLQDAFRAQRGDAAAGGSDVAAIDQFARHAPTLVTVLSTPVQPSKIPLWEQQLSAGAACMNLVTAATAHGFVAGWLTGWAAFDDKVCAALGGREGDRIAGFVFIGSPGQPLEERPRPVYHDIVRHWP
ncbi:nitroreductase [Sphingomonas changnyeongensis]|uniref:Putative NAD(P)H nitroreductase n=1 Tax=Sphingomonas changnyeongensis TaxID=2698679 RepID=A0A7Z2S9T7_9SPHN|nr:nitroreductase [Sphingomonas changnyeongensis]QHL91109.1 nitroreductase [Sphingomonas changnyeongensis]